MTSFQNFTTILLPRELLLSIEALHLDKSFIPVSFSRGTVDSIILSMSKRISLHEDEVKLMDLMDTLEGRLNDDSTRSKAVKNIEDNKQLIASEKYLEISKFIDDYLKRLDEWENQLILPQTSEPKYYQIHIDARNIHTGDRAYKGEVEIEVLIKEVTDRIIFHSKSQVIDDIKVFNKNDLTEVTVLDHHLYPPADTLTIYFLRELVEGSELLVLIKYSTNMMTYEAGFHQTSYVMDGRTRYVGATQFQATDGRYAFPHYDEPRFKVVFELTITHDASFNAISNTFGAASSKLV